MKSSQAYDGYPLPISPFAGKFNTAIEVVDSPIKFNTVIPPTYISLPEGLPFMVIFHRVFLTAWWLVTINPRH